MKILGKGVMPRKEPGLDVLCFGDNFSGDMSGFLIEDGWALVELWHDSGDAYRVNQSFGAYIRARMLMGPNGEDLRVVR